MSVSSDSSFGRFTLKKAICEGLSKAIDDIEKLWNENQADQTCCWDVYGPYTLRASFFKLAYKLPIFEKQPDGITEIISRRASMVQGDDRGSALRYFRDYIPTLDCETIDHLFTSLPMDYQLHLINGLTKSQAAELRPCITKKFLSLCHKVQGLDEWVEKVSDCLSIVDLLILLAIRRVLFDFDTTGSFRPLKLNLLWTS